MYIIAVQEGLPFFIGWLSPLFKFLKKWLPRFTETPGNYPKRNIL